MNSKAMQYNSDNSIKHLPST